MGGFDLEGNYIRVEGFEITAAKPATAVQLHASHCEVLDNYIHDMMVAVNGTVGKPSVDGGPRDYSAVAHNRIAYNKVYHSEYGFILGGEDWRVENNEVSRLFMYAPGNKNDDCDYSRFFGKGCVQRYNYYHGSTRQEIKSAHVDCLQTFTVNGELAMDLLFEDNTCFDFHQMCMVESAPHIGSVRGWTFRRNIVSPNAATLRGGWGPDIIQTLDVTIENCTISTVNWATIGLRGKESTGGLIRNNILCEAERAVVDGDQDFSAANPVIEHNLTFKTQPLAGEANLNGKDPLFEDPRKRNFRLKQGSPAIGAGKDGVTIGALEHPNVYYVDPRHPAASDDPAWGYPAVPLASLAKACAIAQAGETIVLRGGVYREVLAPKNDGVTVRASRDEPVKISRADLIEGWTREADGSWSAPLTTEPKQVLRDARPWKAFGYDHLAKRITLSSGGDPRLHIFETVVRKREIDLAGKKDVKIEGIAVVNTPGPQKRTPEQVLLLMNGNSPASRAIADDYALKRQVKNRLAVQCQDSALSAQNETITLDAYTQSIESPVRAFLATHTNIDFIVLTKGIPIRINGSAMGSSDENSREPENTRGHPSVDSYLSALDYTNIPGALKIHLSGSGGIGWAFSNRYWNAVEPFSHAKFGGYLVTRLDGYTEADATALTARSLAAEQNISQPLAQGKVLLDVEPSFGLGDKATQPAPITGTNILAESAWSEFNADMRHASDVLTSRGIPVELDLTPTFIGGRSNLLGYFSWGSNDQRSGGSNDAYSTNAYLSLFFAPGALCDTAVSTSARTFLPTTGGQSLLVDLIAHGLTGGKGYTDEPLLQAIASPTIVFDRYTAGYTLAESFYAASHFVGWEDVVIGDPLCCPY